ncbi:MAG: aminotransferase class III-fold pyridoxal phosphate-dependent enzyme [Parachlamydiaceae bacterium]
MTTHSRYPLSDELVASHLMHDKRVVEAKRLLQEAVADHKKQLTGIRPPCPGLTQTYESMLADMAAYRAGKLWFPYLGSGIGNGPLVELADGSVKYDLICGIGPHFLGHNHPSLLDSSIDAALSNTIMQGNLQQNVDSLELAAQLVKASGLAHCFLTTSGAMANENALKIALQKHYPASRILAFDHCFAGRSITSSQITDKPGFREGLPTNIFVDYVPFFDPDRPEESTAHALEAVRKYIARYPKQHAVMVFELIQGEGGFHTATQHFFTAIMSLLKENKIAIFADEVQSFGRTPELFAFQYLHLQQFIDIASIGKMSQVCATFFTEEYTPKPGLLSQTFTGSTSAIKASLVILNELLHGGYFGPKGKIQQMHTYFVEKLKQIAQQDPYLLRGPFGLGAMIAFTPYDGDSKQVNEFVHRLFHAGVMSFVAGSHPTRVRFLIPVGGMTLRDIDQVIAIISHTLQHL